MSTPLELPMVGAPADHAAAEAFRALPERPALRVVPEAPAPVEPVDFDDFVRRHTPRLRRQLMRKLGDISESEEIAQETLLRAHQHLHTLATEDELIAWTTVVGQRLAIDRLRVRGRSVSVADVPEDSRVGRDTADIVVARAEARTALESLEAIPERQAAILWAREVEGLHYDAIAVRFGISEPAVRSLLHRGRRALRQEYAARGGTLPLRGLVPLAPSLLALRGLGRLRAAARETVKSHASAFATLSIAGALALGMTIGTGVGPFATRLPEGSLSQGRSTQQSVAGAAGLTVAGDVRAAEIGAPGAGSTVGGPAAGNPLVTKGVRGRCATKDPNGVCVENGRAPGDMLWLGPALPENPIARRVGVGQDLVGVCEHVPGTPVTECSKGQTKYTVNPPNDLPPSTPQTPVSLEGAPQ